MRWPPATPLFSARSSVNLSPIGNLDHKNAKHMVVYVADDSTVADTVTPVRAEHGSGQRLANAARVFLLGNALVHEIDNAPRRLLVELA